jgi:murein DD-endopeptidase MepM/ murein hydrolase activator NlpD
LLLSAVPATAQSLYKYRGESGEWMYSDRPPDDDSLVEVRALEQSAAAGEVSVRYVIAGSGIDLVADNGLYAPVELKLRIDAIQGLHVPADDPELRWVLPSRSATVLITLDLLDKSSEPSIDYRFEYLAGDPGAQHRPSEAYRVPFSIASDFPVSQAYPDNKTHVSPDSYYAIDVAMPIGTDIFAARAGIVFDVASDNFKSGLNPERDGPLANVVRILHDDGTYAIYAHLNWNSIRVKPGDRVERGQYIADSGNTGFSSGPHLHFAVVRNAGLRIESVPIEFQGAGTTSVKPATGMALKAY